MRRKFATYIVIIIIILTAIFLSRQPFFRERVKSLFEPLSNTIQNYLKNGSDWVVDSFYPKISGEVEKRGDAIKQEIDAEKEKISQTIGEKIKEYFSGVVDNIFNPDKKDEKVQQDQQSQQDWLPAEPQAIREP